MERVAFLIEGTGERVGCLLNPESVVMRREAGITARRSHGGLAAGAGLEDDPIIATGGGRTELELDLLFDVQLEGSTIETEDVRDLTRPLWDLAENASEPERYGVPRFARFVWGKAWNIPGVIVSVAERLEYFTINGVPQRSWLRMRMLRAKPPAIVKPIAPGAGLTSERDAQVGAGMNGAVGDAALSGEAGVLMPTKRIDEEAYERTGDAANWRLIADEYGGLDDLFASAATAAAASEPSESEPPTETSEPSAESSTDSRDDSTRAADAASPAGDEDETGVRPPKASHDAPD